MAQAHAARISNNNQRTEHRAATTHRLGGMIVNNSASKAKDLIGDLKVSLKAKPTR